MLRTAEGLSQTELAAEMGISRSYLSLVENEKKTPGLSFFQEAAKYFKIPTALLFVEPESEDSDVFYDLQRILGNVLAAKVRLGKQKTA